MSKIDKISLYVYKQLNDDILFNVMLGLLMLGLLMVFAMEALLCTTVFL